MSKMSQVNEETAGGGSDNEGRRETTPTRGDDGGDGDGDEKKRNEDANDERDGSGRSARSNLEEENERLREELRSMRRELSRLRNGCGGGNGSGSGSGRDGGAPSSPSSAYRGDPSSAAAAEARPLTEPPLPMSSTLSPPKSRGDPPSLFGRALGTIASEFQRRVGACENDGAYSSLPQAASSLSQASSYLEEDLESQRESGRGEGLEMNPLGGGNETKAKNENRSAANGDAPTETTATMEDEGGESTSNGDRDMDAALGEDAAAVLWNRPPPENGVDYDPFMDVMKDRASWLVGLLVLQSMSSFIIARNEALLESHLVIVQFLTMLVGAGGNAGNQASVRVIRGLAVGTLNERTLRAFLWTEAKMAMCLSCILGVSGLVRAAVFRVPAAETTAITASLHMIVFSSIFIGSLLPLGMKYCRIDPAHSSTTIQVLMDILGVTLTVHVSSFILNSGLGPMISSWFGGGGEDAGAK